MAAASRKPDFESTRNRQRSVGTHGKPLPHRVLVCEDDKDIADLLAAALKVRAREVLVCHDGTSAVREVAKWRPAVAIIDIGLPGVTGYGVAQHIRGLPFGREVVLIAITGYDSPADIEMARYAGFNWHFAKPARPSALIAVVEDPSRTPASKSEGMRLDR
jgi:CheY-like chemotaxis protein